MLLVARPARTTYLSGRGALDERGDDPLCGRHGGGFGRRYLQIGRGWCRRAVFC